MMMAVFTRMRRWHDTPQLLKNALSTFIPRLERQIASDKVINQLADLFSIKLQMGIAYGRK
jgi:hypothetical protein